MALSKFLKLWAYESLGSSLGSRHSDAVLVTFHFIFLLIRLICSLKGQLAPRLSEMTLVSTLGIVKARLELEAEPLRLLAVIHS